jgi:hypothetical protein
MSKKKKKHKKIRFAESYNVSSKGFNSLSNDEREILAQQLYELNQAVEKGDIKTAMNEFDNMSTIDTVSYTEESIDMMISDLLYGENNDNIESYREPVFQGDRVLNNNSTAANVNIIVSTDGNTPSNIVSETIIKDIDARILEDINKSEDEDFDDEYMTCELITHALKSYSDELFSLDNDVIISEIDNFTEVVKLVERIFIKMLETNGMDMEGILRLRKRMFEDMGLVMSEEISNIELAKDKLRNPGLNNQPRVKSTTVKETVVEVIEPVKDTNEPIASENITDDDDLDFDNDSDNGWSDVSVDTDSSTEELTKDTNNTELSDPIIHKKPVIGSTINTISDEELDSVVIMPRSRKSLQI